MGRPQVDARRQDVLLARLTKLLPGQPTPLVVDHDMEREVGVVHELFTMEWTDGPWICARATVEKPPGWLRTYQTKASFGSWRVHSTTHDDGWVRVTRALVKEVSLLSPAVEPAEPLACVTLSSRPRSRPLEPHVRRLRPLSSSRATGSSSGGTWAGCSESGEQAPVSTARWAKLTRSCHLLPRQSHLPWLTRADAGPIPQFAVGLPVRGTARDPLSHLGGPLCAALRGSVDRAGRVAW